MNLHLSYIPFFDTIRIIETGVFNIFVWNFHRLCDFSCFMPWQREFLEIMVYCEDFPIDHPVKFVIQICCSRTGSEHKILKKSLCQGILWYIVCRSHQTACIILSFLCSYFLYRFWITFLQLSFQSQNYPDLQKKFCGYYTIAKIIKWFT